MTKIITLLMIAFFSFATQAQEVKPVTKQVTAKSTSKTEVKKGKTEVKDCDKDKPKDKKSCCKKA